MGDTIILDLEKKNSGICCTHLGYVHTTKESITPWYYIDWEVFSVFAFNESYGWLNFLLFIAFVPFFCESISENIANIANLQETTQRHRGLYAIVCLSCPGLYWFRDFLSKHSA